MTDNKQTDQKTAIDLQDRRLSVAPMMDWTDRHCRYFLRLITRRAWLFTEMVTTGAIMHGDTDRFLRFHEEEHPVALQLGGSDPADLARAAQAGAEYGYDEINLNCGCPSDRVQRGMIGACLMAHPALVADGVKAMQDAVGDLAEITVKTRIGIDDQDSYQFLCDFVGAVSDTGCKVVTLHARKAWLSGLSPKENREIPPLRYDVAAQIKQDFPHMTVILNGGLRSAEDVAREMPRFDGMMIGRAAYQTPMVLGEMETVIYGDSKTDSRTEILAQMAAYAEQEMAKGTPLKSMTRHLMGLYHGLPGGRAYRRHLSEAPIQKTEGPEVITQAGDIAEAEIRRIAEKQAERDAALLAAE